MLVISRKIGQRIKLFIRNPAGLVPIGEIELSDIRGNVARIGFEAHDDLKVLRSELDQGQHGDFDIGGEG